MEHIFAVHVHRIQNTTPQHIHAIAQLALITTVNAPTILFTTKPTINVSAITLIFRTHIPMKTVLYFALHATKTQHMRGCVNVTRDTTATATLAPRVHMAQPVHLVPLTYQIAK